ncbi:MAG TPA: HAD family hydrolase [Firmicutes bacterium]|nr:HAD family hydrolase [Bacillota bacterium]
MLLTFDLDGVVMKNPFSTGVFPEVTRRIGEKTGLSHQQILEPIIAEARSRMALGKMVDAYNWDEIVSLVARRLGFTEPIDIAALVRRFSVPGHIYVYPEVPETLEFLRSVNHNLVVLTNGFRKYQLPVLQALGVADFFDAIFTPEVSGTAKPHREFFLQPQKRYPGPHIHVGDMIIHDIMGANQVGATSVWVCHDLPPSVAALPIRERTSHAQMEELVSRGIQRDLNASDYSGLTIASCMPGFVIRSFGELVDVVGMLTQC